jgi:hypothetical protein
MDTILVVNAGSSSVKFQVFGTGREGAADRLIKGQMDGIGTRLRPRAQAADNSPLIDQSYAPEQVGDVRAARSMPANGHTAQSDRSSRRLDRRPAALARDRPLVVDRMALVDGNVEFICENLSAGPIRH